ncbi:hypothetical protein MPTK1_3g15650 [Marchantia polymorpha subsp. ruderalis]|uniref:Protein disulfide-isomerase n=2 Tax=Marchantia polymorpha TaxID=3197 RepID=A0AAF6B162_MARPO|nr:hypothetical protein MARPO_0004s0107 [Marchantia polymorpha]PTQ48834.1 hypothetical protein MARPO_0004s0107 [Marchantia polymorpha]BBN05745.1 hypothetical protein Mp_3g15650 [Marchantia polymorpha subsp. ruderalis]BBN05746.1 hypothetical protein Mp_3g15650 [Marchantia polymorpha subsp. ruderalis]|eukprot:PTQ48833.1 hypothetical protein MARPO_0004s0107 [Marchantia polymorpha]
MGKASLFLLGLLALSAVCVYGSDPAAESDEASASLQTDVLTLEVGNFSETVEKHDFIVVEFYAPWCGHCKRLEPEYEKAATQLKENDPPIILAKVNVDAEQNKPLASEFDIKGFPTLKIIKNKGQSVQEYKGPREAEGIVSYLKKISGPPSLELTSAEQAGKFITDNEGSLVIIGVFDKLEGEHYANYLKVADALRSDYEFCHTTDASYIPEDGVPVKTSSVRLIKNFDDKVTVFTDFTVEALTNSIEEASLPYVTEMSKKPEHRPALMKFFESSKTKLFLFLAETPEGDNSQKDLLKTFSELAKAKKANGLIALFADAEESANALQFFGLAKEDAPASVIQDSKGKKYLFKNAEGSKLSSWVDAYLNGELKEHIKSEAIPETNDEPVKVIVANSFNAEVVEAKKNVFLEFYAPWCGHCKKLAPILDEVATSFEGDSDVVIAKFDATANDVPGDLFDVQGFPTLYMYSAEGVVTTYDGERSKEDIIKFINENRTKSAPVDKAEKTVEDVKAPVIETIEKVTDPVKDEL